MEQNKQVLEFEIISGDDKLIKEIVVNYNKTYHTDFEIIEFIYDEVVFARVRVTDYEISDIFDLGTQFGTFAEYKRQNKEIEW